MTIQYLTYLRDNPFGNPSSLTNKEQIIGLTIEEIEQLELSYNNGNPFPLALKELLYLAGNGCYVLDRGLNRTQSEMQDMVREILVEERAIVSRPFYVIDVYNAMEQSIFVYLDEGNNPKTYGFYYSSYGKSPEIEPPFIDEYPFPIVEFINHRIERNKLGRNPF